MPKETRKIAGSIRHNGTLYTADDLDELEAVLTPEQAARLTEKGVISGFGKQVKEDKPVEDKPADAPVEKPKK